MGISGGPSRSDGLGERRTVNVTHDLSACLPLSRPRYQSEKPCAAMHNVLSFAGSKLQDAVLECLGATTIRSA